MTKLYEEAIADSKKLRELLKEEAEKELVQKYSALINKSIDAEIESFLFEQDEPVPPAPVAGAPEPALDAKKEPTGFGSDKTFAQPLEAAKPLGGETMPEPVDNSLTAPITPVGGNATMPLPGADGKITVSFENLFSGNTGLPQPEATPAAGLQPEATPAPVVDPQLNQQPDVSAPEAPQSEATPAPAEAAEESEFDPSKLQEARDLVGTLENEVADLFESGKLGLKQESVLSYKLLEAYSEIENMKILKEIKESQFDIFAFKMENLYKLVKNSQKVNDSYVRTKKITEGNQIMKVHPKTRSFLNSLLESLETGFGDDGEVEKVSEPLDTASKVADKATKAAMKASRPKIEDKERGQQAPFKHKAKEDESLLKEESDMELDEEIAALEKSLDEMLVDETDEGEEEGELGLDVVLEAKKAKKAAKAEKSAKKAELFKKAKKLKEQLAAVEEELDECGDMSAPTGGKTTITISTDGDVKTEPGTKVDLEDETDMDMSGDDDLEEEDMFEIVMDEEDELQDQDESWDMDETKASPEGMPSGLNETKLVKKYNSLKEQNKSLEQVAARSLYINKIFANFDGLSKKQKEHIVEYFDRAKSVEDAKRIYGRVKAQLNEVKAEADKKSGKKAESLNESVTSRKQATGTGAEKIVIGSADRFKELVGNKQNR